MQKIKPTKEEQMKTKEEVLNQLYISAKDIQVLIPGLNIIKCRELIEEIQQEMKEKNLYVPPSTKPRRALTKLARKKLGI